MGLINADDMIKSLMDMTFYDEEGHIIDDYEDRLAIVKSFVDSVPIVEAIPIEWIKEYIRTHPASTDIYFKWMIDEWKEEQENEQSEDGSEVQ